MMWLQLAEAADLPRTDAEVCDAAAAVVVAELTSTDVRWTPSQVETDAPSQA